MIGLYVYDGVRYIRIDQFESITEHVEERKTDRYAVDPRIEQEFTRTVVTKRGREYTSPGTADELLGLIHESLGRYMQIMEGE